MPRWPWGTLEVVLAGGSEGEEVRERFRKQVPKEAREHIKPSRGQMRRGVEAVLPLEPAAHREEVCREMLFAPRSLTDHALDRMAKTDSG